MDKDKAERIGSVRTLELDMKEINLRRMREMVPTIAKAYGGEATIEIQNNTAITYNDPELTSQMLPTLEKVAGKDHIELVKATTGGEDFFILSGRSARILFFPWRKTTGRYRVRTTSHSRFLHR